VSHWAGAVIDGLRESIAPEDMLGVVCGHIHRSEDAARDCARREHKRVSFKGRITGIRAYALHVKDDGTTDIFEVTPA
jgi:hypothetical protein